MTEKTRGRQTWNRAEEVFAAALEVPEPERAAFVKEQCEGRATLRDEVLSLLAARDQMGDFLQAPALDFSGQTFGAYRAVREIGRGGMSVVYAGERAEGGFEKAVAIKVLLLQSSGAAADPTHGETQILAGLEHSNIARLLDAGTTDLGFRYLVMELVEGQPITGYCRALGEERKLRLFLDVCAAVHHAHRSLVVHRDLKPDNILVNGEGVAKLLDFGIAKMLPQGGTAQTRGIRAYTPDYASPEQILGQPVTTSSDIYSLGVLLCELTGGRVPRAMAGLDMAALVDAAQNREVTELPLAGDLAAIARKALRREPGERYESASALGRDVERYLAGLPVEARPPAWSYRAGKFIRRRKYAVAAASAAVIALAATAGIAVWQARLASTRFEQVRRLARSVMFDLYDAVTPLQGSLAARQLVVTQSLEYLAALENDTRASEEVQLDVARGYLRLADIQGKDYGGASVGSVADALKSASRALAIARRVYTANPRSNAAGAVLVDTLEYTATAQLLRRETDAALPLAREAVTVAERLAAEAPGDGGAKKRLATVIKQLASVHDARQEFKASIPLYQRSLGLRKSISEADPGDAQALQRYAEGHHWLGQAQFRDGDLEAAERNGREAYRLDKLRMERQGPDKRRSAMPNLASDISFLAAIAGRKKRHEEALGLYREMLEIRRELLAAEPKSSVAALRLAAALDRVGNTLVNVNRPAEGLPMLGEALQQARTVFQRDRENGNAAREVVFALQDLGRAYDRVGDGARACAALGEAQAMIDGPWKKLGPEAKTPYAAEIVKRRGCPAKQP